MQHLGEGICRAIKLGLRKLNSVLVGARFAVVPQKRGVM
jgi:hypothetical protein